MYEVLNSAARFGLDFPSRPAIPSQLGPNSPGPVCPASLGGSGHRVYFFPLVTSEKVSFSNIPFTSLSFFSGIPHLTIASAHSLPQSRAQSFIFVVGQLQRQAKFMDRDHHLAFNTDTFLPLVSQDSYILKGVYFKNMLQKY